jgi:PAS domain S-box-containing protein
MTGAETGEARLPAVRAVLSATTYALELVLIAGSYFGLVDIALLLPAINPTATPLWPPTGIAFAIVLLRGYRVWPAILVGSFSANTIPSPALTASSLFQSSSIGIGTALAALVGAWLINRWSHGTRTFTTPLGIARFMITSLVPTAMISSAIAMIGSLFASEFGYAGWVRTWAAWWLADATGTILVAPVIVLWAITPLRPVTKSSLMGAVVIFIIAAAIGIIAVGPMKSSDLDELLSHRGVVGFLILLPLMWAGLHGKQRDAATAALIFCGIAGWGLSTGASPISAPDLNGSLILLLALSISTTGAPLVLGAVIGAHRDRETLLLSAQSQFNLTFEQAKAELKSSKRHFQILVEGVADYAFFVLDTSGRVASWNSTAQKIIGYQTDEIIGKHFSILYRPDERRAGVPNRALSLATQKGKYEVEGWRIRKNATPFFVTGALTAIRDDNANLIGFASIIRDASERRETQEQLVEAREQLAMAQKMEAIGKLTGGIAHDFNNLLMIIGGNAQTFKRLLDPKLPRAIEAIQAAAKRGESLTRQLLTFSRRQHLSLTVIDLNASIRNMRTLIESSLRGNIVYNENVAPNPWPVKVDLAELELAIVNIAVNARDAMPNGGAFTIAAGNMKADDEADGAQQSGDFVAIEFTDTGMGIPPDLHSKIFDPFFTTKEVDKGTGLGLSQVYGFAHQAGGTVKVESKVGLGTTIIIYLPSYAGSEVAKEEIAEVDAARSERPKVLVVDDSAEVAEVTSSLFEDLGYDTVYRNSAEAALDLLAEGAKIDLVFTDIVMPGTIDGVGLANEVRSRYPHLPVILTTGYSDATQVVSPDLQILHKPFDADALRSAIQDMMKASVASSG